MKRCPHCGGTTGYFTREVATYCYYSRFDGSADEDNNGKADLNRVNRNKTVAYCTDCGKRIALLEEIAAQE